MPDCVKHDLTLHFIGPILEWAGGGGGGGRGRGECRMTSVFSALSELNFRKKCIRNQINCCALDSTSTEQSVRVLYLNRCGIIIFLAVLANLHR
jgi:hypothetical protein